MTQPLLLEAPKNRTRLDLWKELHRVRTARLSKQFETDPSEFFIAWKGNDTKEPETLGLLRITLCGDFIGEGPDEESACFSLAAKLDLPWIDGMERRAD